MTTSGPANWAQAIGGSSPLPALGMCILCCCFHRCVFSVSQSCQLLATPGTVTHQAPLSMAILRQEYWSGLPFPSPGGLPDPGIEPGPPALGVQSLTNWTTREAPDCFIFLVRKKSRNVTCILPQSDGWKMYALHIFYRKVSVEIENSKYQGWNFPPILQIVKYCTLPLLLVQWPFNEPTVNEFLCVFRQHGIIGRNIILLVRRHVKPSQFPKPIHLSFLWTHFPPAFVR